MPISPCLCFLFLAPLALCAFAFQVISLQSPRVVPLFFSAFLIRLSIYRTVCIAWALPMRYSTHLSMPTRFSSVFLLCCVVHKSWLLNHESSRYRCYRVHRQCACSAFEKGRT